MVAATSVTVSAFADLPANDLQTTLADVYGKAVYAADTVGAVQGTAQYAADTAGAADFKLGELTPRVDAMEGTLAYAADGVGTLDYHLRQIATLVGYTMPA